MVGPCWRGEEDWFHGSRVEFGEKKTTQVDGACARDSLEACYLSVVGQICEARNRWRTYSLLLDRWTVSTQYELLSGIGEVCQAGNRQIFVVQVGVSS